MMTKKEAKEIINAAQYWYYSFDLPWGRVNATNSFFDIRHKEQWPHFFKPLLEIYRGSLAGKRVLDLACCQGFWSFEVCKTGASSCLGIDSSEEFIIQAQALKTIFGFEYCEFQCHDLEKRDWWEEIQPSHITLLLGVLHHLVDPIAVLLKAMSLTQETLVLDVEVQLQGDSTLTFFPKTPDLLNPTVRNPNSSQIRAVATRAMLEDLLRKGGFVDIKILTPQPGMSIDYLNGSRISIIARR